MTSKNDTRWSNKIVCNCILVKIISKLSATLKLFIMCRSLLTISVITEYLVKQLTLQLATVWIDLLVFCR